MNATKQMQEAKRYVNLHTEEVSSLPERLWMEGYLIGYSPLEEKEGPETKSPQIELEWSLETGESVFQKLTIADGYQDGDASFEKLITIFNVLPFQVNFLNELLVKRCGLLVTAEWITDEETGYLTYELHDLCSLEELQNYRIHYTEKSEREEN